jgi:hypothetical protein
MENKAENNKHSLEQRLSNYKSMHQGTAKSKNCLQDFMSARTLTEARKILWGFKKKNTRAKK